jgi:hypothetical protein
MPADQHLEPPMALPERLTVPTCIGCGAMGEFGTCASGCSEQKLELARAAVCSALAELTASARARLEDLRGVAEELAWYEPGEEEWEAAYRSVQEKARTALRRCPDLGWQDVELDEPVEPATTWWCAECGSIDGPQECLGICIWQRVEWVNYTVYEYARERALRARGAERHLRRLLRSVVSVTPRSDQWQRSWLVFETQARELIDRCNEVAPPLSVASHSPSLPGA